MKNFVGKTTKVVVAKTKKQGTWTKFPSLCKSCGICIEKCPFGALSYGKEMGVYSAPTPDVDPEKCTLCGLCDKFCPDCAINCVNN